jgi:TPR repeat protein
MVKAAEQGSSDAMNDLGVYYKDGLGVDQNYTRAASWFRKGAELGNAFAKFNLALLHTSGLGVEIDLNKSTKLEHKWLLAFYHPEQHKITNRKIIWKKIKASCMYQHGYLLYV